MNNTEAYTTKALIFEMDQRAEKCFWFFIRLLFRGKRENLVFSILTLTQAQKKSQSLFGVLKPWLLPMELITGQKIKLFTIQRQHKEI